jgi:hypothetical protein
LAEKLRALGIPCGIPHSLLPKYDIEYINNGADFIVRNLDDPFSDVVLRDMHRINGCENCCNREEKRYTKRVISPEAHSRNDDVQRSFTMDSFVPPAQCVGEDCENIHCSSRRESHRGEPCVYSKPPTNAELMERGITE